MGKKVKKEEEVEDITKMIYDKKRNVEVMLFKEVPDDKYEVDLTTEKAKSKFVKQVERIARASIEYSDYIGYLRRFCDMAACKFFPNINQEGDGKKVRIEIHHAPLTLYDIVYILLQKALDNGETPNAQMIAKETMRYHYKDQVGLIPLSKTLHELQHPKDGQPRFVLPLYMIYGQWTTFLRENEDTWQKIPYIVSKLQIARDQTKSLTNNSFDKLKEDFVYVSVDGFKVPMKIEDAKEITEKKENAA